MIKQFLALMAIVVLAAGGGALQAHAQNATMPTFYNQSGNAVNTSGTALPAGWYYTSSSGTGNQVYYYGNGTYYDPATNMYGGSVYNPNGTAGATLNTAANTSVSQTTAPGVPNTGLGGQASWTWLILVLAAVAAVGSAGYLVRTRSA